MLSSTLHRFARDRVLLFFDRMVETLGGWVQIDENQNTLSAPLHSR
jgi:hypothetical protein